MAADLELHDLDGRSVRPLEDPAASAVVFLFARTDCPISNRYAPTVRTLHEAFAAKGAAFWLVYPDPADSAEAIRRHIREYGYTMPAVRDPKHALVAATGARVTPEAAVLVPSAAGARMLYRGRIDDWYREFGRSRPAPAEHDLERALEVILEGKPFEPRVTSAVGCAIPPLT